MTPLAWIAIGIVAALGAVGFVFFISWWRMIYKLPSEERRKSVQQDFQEVRDSIRRRNASKLN